MNCGRVVGILGMFLLQSIGVRGETPEEFVQRWVLGLNANDPEVLLEFYDRSEETEIIVSAGRQYRGFKTIQKIYREDAKNVRFSDSQARKLHSRILGDCAIVNFEHRFKIWAVKEKQRIQVHIRTTSMLHRVDGKWRIVMEHSSPIDGIERYTVIEE